MEKDKRKTDNVKYEYEKIYCLIISLKVFEIIQRYQTTIKLEIKNWQLIIPQ